MGSRQFFGAAVLAGIVLFGASAKAAVHAAFTINPSPANVGQTVTFNGSGSTFDAPSTSIIDWTWDYGDDSGNSGTQSSRNHVYDFSGPVTIFLTVTSNDGAIDTISHDLIVNAPPNQPPVAVAGGPYTIAQGSSLSLDGSGSSDPDDGIDTYKWDLDNNSTYETLGESPIVSFAALSSLGVASVGIHTIGLQVTDFAGASTSDLTTFTVTAAPEPAAAGILAIAAVVGLRRKRV